MNAACHSLLSELEVKTEQQAVTVPQNFAPAFPNNEAGEPAQGPTVPNILAQVQIATDES